MPCCLGCRLPFKPTTNSIFLWEFLITSSYSCFFCDVCIWTSTNLINQTYSCQLFYSNLWNSNLWNKCFEFINCANISLIYWNTCKLTIKSWISSFIITSQNKSYIFSIFVLSWMSSCLWSIITILNECNCLFICSTVWIINICP